MGGGKLVCRDCGRGAKGWYWVSPEGRKLDRPRCDACHEAACRRAVRESGEEEKRIRFMY